MELGQKSIPSILVDISSIWSTIIPPSNTLLMAHDRSPSRACILYAQSPQNTGLTERIEQKTQVLWALKRTFDAGKKRSSDSVRVEAHSLVKVTTTATSLYRNLLPLATSEPAGSST